MSAVITIPLGNNQEIADLVADKKPGDKLYTCGTIKALDEQTLTLRVSEVTDTVDDLPRKGDGNEAEDSADDDDMDEDAGPELDGEDTTSPYPSPGV